MLWEVGDDHAYEEEAGVEVSSCGSILRKAGSDLHGQNEVADVGVCELFAAVLERHDG